MHCPKQMYFMARRMLNNDKRFNGQQHLIVTLSSVSLQSDIYWWQEAFLLCSFWAIDLSRAGKLLYLDIVILNPLFGLCLLSFCLDVFLSFCLFCLFVFLLSSLWAIDLSRAGKLLYQSGYLAHIRVIDKTSSAETDFFIMTQKLFNCGNREKKSEKNQNNKRWNF